MANKKYHLFEVFGIELEYMIVDSKTLKVKPIADWLIKEVTGNFTADVENGPIAWSNELVSHVIELKTNGPTPQLNNLDNMFLENIKQINQLLSKHQAILMPTAAHPSMNPFTETVIWPHEYNEVYSLYNKIFDCRGHGWANLQSMHINLPFFNNNEFCQLHTAIRILLPLIPALSASSPILDGTPTGKIDSRMHAYLHHQEKLPQLMGKLIPEFVTTQEEYHEKIFNPIIAAIKPFDNEGVMDHHFLNSRGAISRFDRGAIEIRVIDLQECPKADLAIAMLIVETLKWLINHPSFSLQNQASFKEDDLLEILINVIKNGTKAQIKNSNLLTYFGLPTNSTALNFWQFCFNEVKNSISLNYHEPINHILKFGNLSERILEAHKTKTVSEIYSTLTHCLQQNTLFYAPNI